MIPSVKVPAVCTVLCQTKPLFSTVRCWQVQHPPLKHLSWQTGRSPATQASMRCSHSSIQRRQEAVHPRLQSRLQFVQCVQQGNL